jgi:hypothetical protein
MNMPQLLTVDLTATALLGAPDLRLSSRPHIQLTHCSEFQIPPQVARYASFMFSFIGRGVCEYIKLLGDKEYG